MKQTFLLILFFSLINCGRYNSPTARKQMKKIYLSEFEMRYFKSLLLTAYNNSQSIKNILENDTSSFTEPILSLDDLKIIDSLVKADNKILIMDSINSYVQKAEGAQGKAVFYFALKKYNSNWLDSLAQKRYTFYKQSEKDFRKSLRRN